mmetsp:Transcript_81171/g.215477  ORF Transcript_81171/g.215477 Transcript_81171/m.215477 type:complete len:260 (+) Transcript_81171:253-1032(+)
MGAGVLCETLRILATEGNRADVLLHDRVQRGHIQREERGMLLRCCCAMVEPLDPDDSLAQPIRIRQLVLLFPHAAELVAGNLVFQEALNDEEHPVSHLPLAEERLLRHEGDLLRRVVANGAHSHGAQLVERIEEGVPRQDGHVDLVVKVHLQRVRDLPEEFHVPPRLPATPSLGSVLQVPPDAHCQLHGDLVLAQVLPQDQVLSSLQPVGLAQTCHCLGDAADERREGDHCQDHDAHVVGPLTSVGGEHLHRSWCELCQ